MNPAGFRADVLGKPAMLAGLIDAYAAPDSSPLAALERHRPEHVVLIGMGSSRYAALTAAAALRRQGIAAVAEYASTAAPARPAPSTLAVGISASGTTPETVEALDRHHGTSATVAITNASGSPLAQAADTTLPLLAGEETGGVACRTFQATLAVLQLLAARLTGASAGLRPAVEAAAALAGTHETWLPDLRQALDPSDTLYAIAPAERISSALQSALMIREGPRRPAAACETGDWLHVDVYLSKHPGYRALLFGGSRFDQGVMEWARERASTIVAVGRPVRGAALHIGFPHADDPHAAALADTMVAELLAAAWWLEQ